ncbi:MAG: hypothetical protein HC915_17470 [Anaerolineae bacterium]|nr:hypothetical protein [Anaerolineae bacterium]
MKGRPLWHSLLEVTFIADVDPGNTRNRFFRQEDLLSYGHYDLLHKGLRQATGLPLKVRVCRLTRDHKGQIDLDYERSAPTIFHRQIAMSILDGYRIYAAPDFLLQKFERDLGATWQNNTAFIQASENRIQEHLSRYNLPPLPPNRVSGLDVLWVGETLAMLHHLINSTHDLRLITFDSFRVNSNLRSRMRYAWRTASGWVSEVALHVISRHSSANPRNFVQLMDACADLGIVPHSAVEGLATLCARPMSSIFTRAITEEDVQAYTLFVAHSQAVDYFLEGMTRHYYRSMLP